jgi:hypothetical protein
MRRESSRAGWNFAALLLLIVVAGSAEQSFAQQVRLMEINEISGYVELLTEVARERRESRNSDVWNATDLRLSEIVQVNLFGSVYHPRFLTYEGGVGVNFGQTKHWDDDSALSDGTLERADWRLDFLGQHPWGVSFWGSALDTDVERPFTRSYELDETRYAGKFEYRVGRLPFELSYQHWTRENTSSGLGGDGKVESTVDDYAASGEYYLNDSSTGTLSYVYSEEENRGFDYTTQDASLTNTTILDTAWRRRLWATARWYNQKKEQLGDTTNTSARAVLDWQHSHTLWSGYSFDFDSNAVEGDGTQRVRNYSGGSFLRHQLYESLTSTLEADIRYEDAWYGTDTSYRGTLREEYTKRLREWGRLSLTAAPFVELIQRRPSEERGFQPDERQRMVGIQPVELRRPSIEASTIVVTDAVGSTIYVEGLDYTVAQSGSRSAATFLTRTLGSNIADGEEVRASYWFEVPGESDILVSGLSMHASMTVRNSLTLYWSYLDDNQRRLSGNPGRDLYSTLRNSVGVRLTRRGFRADAEFERERSDLRSYWKLAQSLTLDLPGGSRWQASITGMHEYLDLEDPAERIRRLALAARVQARLTRRMLLEVETAYALTKWKGDTGVNVYDRNGLVVEGSITYAIKGIETEFGGRYSMLDEREREDSIARLFFSVRRVF